MPITIALFNSIFSFFIISVTAFFTFFSIFSKEGKSKKIVSFAVSWLFLGLAFLFITIRLIAFGFGKNEVDIVFFYLGQIAIALSFPSLMYYTAWKAVNKRKISNLLSVMAGISALFFLFFLFQEGIVGPKISSWGSDYSPSKKASLFFIVPYVISFFLVFFDLVRRIVDWAKTKKIIGRSDFVATISLFTFLLLAAIDEFAIEAGWILVLFRAIMMVAAILASISYTVIE
ncbi:MAG: hypothetical protein GF370_03205 [Candidatus Nealsonbacteria bacterium]|nr:hypothetical protein [Candidatus Nealsonbacteria bacterium]